MFRATSREKLFVNEICVCANCFQNKIPKEPNSDITLIEGNEICPKKQVQKYDMNAKHEYRQGCMFCSYGTC